MGIRDKYKKRKQDLMQRHQESQERKNERPQSFFSYIDTKKLPEGTQMWYEKDGKHRIDVVPFFTENELPTGEQPGDIVIYLDLWVHQNVGPVKKQFLCPKNNWQEPCPICEYISEMSRIGKRLPKAEWNQVKPKRRTAMFVWVHDSNETEELGLQIWEVAHFFFINHIEELAELTSTGEPIIWSDPDEGKMIVFKKATTKSKDQTSVEMLGHALVDRPEPIPNEILDQTFDLTELVYLHPTYEEIADEFFGKGEREDDPEPSSESEDRKPKQLETTKEPESEPELEPDDIPFDKPDGDICPAPEGTFGESCDLLAECQDCEVWDECANKKDEISNTPEPPKKQENTRRRLRRK